jgi:hypothetical protein
MRLSILAVVWAVLAATSSMRAAGETVTVGGAVMPIAEGWKQTTVKGQVVLVPMDLAKGVVCTFTFLGGNPFDGSLKDEVAAEWKELAKLGRMVRDDGVKIDGEGKAVEIGSRSGKLEVANKATLYMWLVIAKANGRCEKMLLITTTAESFTKYAPAVGGMLNGTKYVPVVKAEDVGLAANPQNGAAARGQGEEQKEGSFGHMKYRVPSGWHEKRYASAVVLSPDKIPLGESLEITLMAPTKLGGTMAAGLDAAWDEVSVQTGAGKTRTVDGKPYTVQTEKRSFAGWEYMRGYGILGPASDQHDYYVNLTVMKINDRLERIRITSKQNNHNLDRYSVYDSPAYYPMLQEFLFSVGFDDWEKPKVEAASLKGDGIIGVWNGISFIGGGLHTTFAIFFSNGQVFFASRFPVYGCDEFNTWVDAEMVPRYWGTYTFKDGRGVLKMIYGEIPVEAKGEDLIFTTNKTDHRFVRIAPVDGARLSGEYSFAAGAPTIVFTPDGGFEDHGPLNTLNVQLAYPFKITERPGSGSYSVRDHTISFDYKDGRKFRLAFSGADFEKGKPSPDALNLGFAEQTMRRVK